MRQNRTHPETTVAHEAIVKERVSELVAHLSDSRPSRARDAVARAWHRGDGDEVLDSVAHALVTLRNRPAAA